MAKLSVYLPPFAPDYSGVCSALFDLNALIMIHDAAGCTGNYTGFDEPRWYGSVRQIYCSGLRKADAISGGESRFIERIQKAIEDNPTPDFVALVGSPVPMVIGTDFAGFAAEIENTAGIPAFGFATDGTRYYTDGVFLALKTLIERYAQDAPRRKSVVNLLGATPLDFPHGDYTRAVRALTDAGYTLNISMSLTLDAIRSVGAAEVNLAVSESGLMLARWLKARYGTPYLSGIPEGGAEYADALAACAETGEDGFLLPQKLAYANTLLIADRVAAHSLRRALRIDAEIGVLFGKTAPEPQFAGDMYLPDEAAILRAVNSERYTTVIADPLICGLVKDNAKTLIPIGHYAVSGKQGQRYTLSPSATKIL
jgi:nitrogenase molybdenum-iron protein alpha/beta subunit